MSKIAEAKKWVLENKFKCAIIGVSTVAVIVVGYAISQVEVDIIKLPERIQEPRTPEVIAALDEWIEAGKKVDEAIAKARAEQ